MRTADDPSGVTVLVNGVPSSHLDLEDPSRLSFEYMQQMAVLLGHAAPPGEPLAVVHLGAAGCAPARHVPASRPGSRQIAVELDTALPELVRTWFDLPRAPALRIRAGDARAQLEAMADASADVVVRDVFSGDRTPEHVTTVEFAREVARVLRPGGLYLANCADRPPLALARSEAATLRAVFGHLGVVAEPGLLRGRGYGNVVLAATGDASLLASAQVEREVRSLPAPARMLHGSELHAFVGSARALGDPPGATAATPGAERA
ncbi:spermidine synthase [Cellulomonas timonensis]|uniref:spermidine synthase n=1 Tax=Cellulomonas timonensis TaxID=1689271 RepID=UPI000B164A42|nr:fused MFS/spermidine synthase [Cellulomonas timonensis]